MRNDGDVLEIERGIDLVNDVNGRRAELVERENERQRRERLLAARQIGHVLPALLGRSHAEHDALSERVERVDELEIGVALERDRAVDLLELETDAREAAHELVETLLAERVEFIDELVALRRHFFELAQTFVEFDELMGTRKRRKERKYFRKSLSTFLDTPSNLSSEIGFKFAVLNSKVKN